MQTLQTQLDEINAQIDAECAKGGMRDQNVLAVLEQKQTEIRTQMEQAQAAQQRIHDATEQAAYFLDNLVIEGLTMRELCVDEPEYQMLRIAVQTKIINQAEEYGKQISEIQAGENAQQTALKQRIEELQKIADGQKDMQAQLQQAQLEVVDYQSKLKNATDEIDRLNSHVDDLRKEIAVGARNAYKVVDSEEQGKQLKELADKIKASRIHVYDVVPDSEINAKNYTAKRADTGETVTYNWTQAKNYVELKDPNEVEQFRAQHANQNPVQNTSLVQPVQNGVTPSTAPEATFPVPSAIPPQVPAVPAAVVEGHASTDGQAVKTVEERLSALEKSNLDMQTWIDGIEKRVGKLDGNSQAVA